MTRRLRGADPRATSSRTSRSLNVAENSHSTEADASTRSAAPGGITRARWSCGSGSWPCSAPPSRVFGAQPAADVPRPRAGACRALIGVGFLAFMLFTSNPFLRLDPAPLDGHGLNPILQDPGPRVPSADALSRLCRLLDRLLVRDRGPDRGPGRRRPGRAGCGPGRWPPGSR